MDLRMQCHQGPLLGQGPGVNMMHLFEAHDVLDQVLFDVGWLQARRCALHQDVGGLASDKPRGTQYQQRNDQRQ